MKVFKQLTSFGILILVITFFLGLAFRVVGLENISAWEDEVASWYFARHLGEVFYGESHTPVYYFLCKVWGDFFSSSILSLRYFSVLSSVAIVCGTSFWVARKKEATIGLLLFVLWWLWPTMIMYSRQARNYSLYADLTILILVMWDFRHSTNKFFIWFLLCLYQSIQPIAAIPVAFIVFWDLIKQKNFKRSCFYLSSSLPVVFYYLARLADQGATKVHSNISWISQSTEGFVYAMVRMFFGTSFPFSEFHEISNSGMIILFSVISIVVLFHNSIMDIWRTESFRKFVCVLFVTELIVELLGLLHLNLRVNRYFIYVPAFFVFGISQLGILWQARENLLKAGLLSVSLVGYSLIFHRPWSFYSWDDQDVTSYKKMVHTLPSHEKLICATPYQVEYYFQKPYESCSKKALANLQSKKPFYLFIIDFRKYPVRDILPDGAQYTYLQVYGQAILVSVASE